MRCAFCGGDFEPKSSRQRYCKADCRTSASDARTALKEGKSEPLLRQKQPTYASAEVIDLGKVEETVQKVQTPQKVKNAKKPSYAETLYWHIKRWRAERGEKDLMREPKAAKSPKARREKLYTEIHPKALRTLKFVFCLPFVALFLIYRNQIADLAKSFVSFVSSGNLWNSAWWQTQGIAYSTVLLMGTGVVILGYYVIWRFIFPDYCVGYGKADIYDGRLYWSDTMWPVRLWDRLYRSPERKEIKYWVRQRLFKLTTTVIHTTPEEKMERKDSWSVVVNEQCLRSIIRKERKRLHLRTYTGEYKGQELSLTYVRSTFAARSQVLRDATTYLSQGNPNVQVDSIRGSTVRVSPEFKEAVMDARRKQRQAAAESAAQSDNRPPI